MFRINLFGGLSVARDGSPVEGLPSRRAALLAALAIAGRRGLSRDRLLLFLWPDATEERARHSLAQSVYSLHKLLGQEIVESGAQELRLAESLAESDLAEFFEAHARGDWGTAAALYRGPLLDGFLLADASEFDTWVSAERARVEGLARDAIEADARQADESGDPLAASRWRRLVELDPLTSRYAIGYARALTRSADPGSAVRHLREHIRLLKNELNLPAPAEVSALISELTRRAQPEPPRRVAAEDPGGPAEAVDPMATPAAIAGEAESIAPEPTEPRAPPIPTPALPARTRRWLIPATLVVAGALAVGWTWWIRQPARAVTGGARVVLTDVENLTSDSTLGRAMTAAFQAGLAQAGNFSLYPRARLRATLARMGRAITDTTLSESLAREVAAREAGQAVVSVAVVEVGDRFDLSGRIVDPASGQTLAARRIAVSGRAGLLDAAGTLTAWIRQKLGDLRWDTGPPLPLVTTSSLPALEAVGGAFIAYQDFEFAKARALLEHAFALDTGFAWAQAMLGNHHLLVNNVPEALRWLREADRRAARLTEPEQLQVRTLLARAEGRYDAMADYAATLADRFPSSPNWALYGGALRFANRDPEAVTAFRRALAIDSNDLDAYHGLALAQRAVGNYREALDAFAAIDRRDSTFLLAIFYNQQWGETYVLTGDLAGADSVFRRMLTRPRNGDRARGHRALAYLALYQGRFREATHQLRAAIQLQDPGSLSEYRDQLLLADVSRTLGDRRVADAALDRALAIFHTANIQAAAVMFGGHQLVRAGRLEQASLFLDSLATRARLRPESEQDQAALAILRGDLALARRRPADARQALDRRDFEAYDALGFQLRAETFEALGPPDSALAMARLATERFRFGLEVQTDWLRSFETLGRVAEAAGDQATAREAWSKLIELWKNADPDLPPLLRARQELARLQAEANR
ncbi:MAG: hypothetical protein AB7R55_00385 [Gemmatimonadales bacterium]